MIPCGGEIQIRNMARQFAQERLEPFTINWDHKHCSLAEAVREMADFGLLGMLVSEGWDGVQTGHLTYAIVLEEIVAGDGVYSTVMNVHNSIGCMPIHKFGSAEQKKCFLRPLIQGSMFGIFALIEPQASSDTNFLKTRTYRDDDHYVLNGTKQFTISGNHVGMVIVFTVTNPDARKHDISAFIVPIDTPGYEVVWIEDEFGQHASDTCQLAFNDLCILTALCLDEEGEDYRITLTNPEGSRIGIAAQAVDMTCVMFEAAHDHTYERETFGKPIIEHQAVVFRLANMATRIVVT